MVDIGDNANIEEINAKLSENIQRDDDGTFSCMICGKSGVKCRRNMKNHVETHMEGLFFQCEMCDKTTKTRQAMRRHYNVHHENAPFLSLFD